MDKPLANLAGFEDSGAAELSDHDADADEHLREAGVAEIAGVGGEEVAMDVRGVALSDVGSPPGVDLDDVHSGSSSSSSGSSANAAGGVALSDPEDTGHELQALYLPVIHGGYIVSDDPYTDVVNPARSHARLRTACTTHARCAKRRGRGLAQTRRHGEWEPVAFLVAWQQCARPGETPKQHRESIPTAAEVDGAFAELREAYGA